MSAIGNLLWMFFGGGLVIAFGYAVVGIAFCVTIIGIPFGFQLLKLAALSLLPFGKTIHSVPSANGCLSVIFNILWIVVGGFWIAVSHLLFALMCAVTIIGIPFAAQHLKLTELALTPFGKEFR